MEWEDIGKMGLGIVLVIGFIILCTLSIAPHKVDSYYLSHGQSSTPGVCVYNHWDWHPDEIVFCTDDAQKALNFTVAANATIKSK